MPKLTLEKLAKRVEAIEKALKSKRTRKSKSWRRVVGMFAGSEFMREVDDECLRAREAERKVARREDAGE